MSAISLVNVAFAFGARPVIDGLSLAVRSGTHTAVQGANGSGKSTLLGLVTGILQPSRGEIRIDSPARPALVLQHSAASAALPLTVRQAVAMGCWGHRGWLRRMGERERSAVAEALRALALSDIEHRQLGELSGGQRQRVLVAQGLAQGATLLVLDEPTAGVDAESHARIRDIIAREVARGVTVMEATHSDADAAQANRVVTLDQGRVVSDSGVVKVG